MEQKCGFEVKEFLWRQTYPVDPTSGLAFYATVLEDAAGRRMIVYADPNRKTEAFEPDGTPIAVTAIPCTTESPSSDTEQQAHLIEIGGDPARRAVTRAAATAAASVKTCIKYGSDGMPRKVTCPPWTC